MPSEKFAPTRNDGAHIGPAIKEMVRLMLEEGLTRDQAADAVGFNRKRARRALSKAHVISYRRHERMKLLDELSADVPRRLHELMMKDDNQNAAVRACVALNEMAERASEEPVTRRLALGGIVIQLGPAPPALPAAQAAPSLTIEHAPQLIEQKAADNE